MNTISTVGYIEDNTTTTFQDNDWSAPMPPTDAPSIGAWSSSIPAGSFVAGNLVRYAVSFTNSAGEESPLGPWSGWAPTSGAAPALSVPTDTTTVIYPAAATTGRKIYRQFKGPTSQNSMALAPTVIGTIADNSTTAFQDNDWGAPMPPSSPPAIANWAQNIPAGTFVAGNSVRYTCTFVNAAGEESAYGAWTPWTPVSYALAELANVPVDTTPYPNPAAGTVARNIYRQFSKGGKFSAFGMAKPERIGTIGDNTTTAFQDNNWGAPMPPTTAPSVSQWAQTTPAGSFEKGNLVQYAVAFVNEANQESLRGPWCDWIEIDAYALPLLADVAVDTTSYPIAASGTTARRIYRQFRVRTPDSPATLDTPAVAIGTISDNTTTTFQDNDWGGPTTPRTGASISQWAQQAPAGSFVNGNQVRYGTKFVNAAGEESPIGSWTPWTPIENYSLPFLVNVPVDTTAVTHQGAATTRRKIYREFMLKENTSQFSLVFSADPQYPWYDFTLPSPSTPVQESERNAWAQSNDAWIRENSRRQITQQYASINALALDTNVNGVVINGDLTAFGHDWQLAVLQELLGKLNPPYLPGLGNHDIGNNLNDTYDNNAATRMALWMYDWLRRAAVNPSYANFSYDFDSVETPIGGELRIDYTGSLAYAFTMQGNLRVIQLNNFPTFSATWRSYLPPVGTARSRLFNLTPSLQWLAAELAASRGRGEVIVVNMHDYALPAAEENSNFLGGDQATFEALIQQYGVSAVFSGHIHSTVGFIGDIPGTSPPIPLFRCGSSGYQDYLQCQFDLVANTLTATVWNCPDLSGVYQSGPPTEYSLNAGSTASLTDSTRQGWLQVLNRCGHSVRVDVRYSTADGAERLATSGLIETGNAHAFSFEAGATNFVIVATSDQIPSCEPRKTICRLTKLRSPDAPLVIHSTDGTPRAEWVARG